MTAPALWLKHRPLARAIARRYFIPGAEPQDVEQEALIGLWIAARDYDGGGAFKPWAAMVIERRVIEAVRASTRGKHTPLNGSLRRLTLDEEGVELDAVDALPCLHQVTDRVEDREQLRAVLHTIDNDLSDYERHCLIGVASGLSYPEIDSDIKRVDNAISRARRKLKAAA